MKQNKNKYGFLLLLLATLFVRVVAQDGPVEAKEIVRLQYFNDNNHLQYFIIESILKKGRAMEPQANKKYNLFMDGKEPANFVAQIVTGENGKAKAMIPANLQSAWDGAASHNFVVVSEAREPAEYEFEFTRSEIFMDTATADSTRNITVKVLKNENGNWVPAKDVEMKIGVARLGGILTVGGEDTYTTDSTGTVTAEFNKVKLPGDAQGNLTLVAKVEDNDQFGNLIVQKKVPWGAATVAKNDFFKQRTLWSTRFRTPLWLLFMAYSIVIGVWSTIIYLIWQIVRIKKLGIQQ